MLVAYKLSKFTDAWEVNACFASMHITFIKFGDQSDYITKFTRFLEIGCFFSAFLWTERLLFATLSLTLSQTF